LAGGAHRTILVDGDLLQPGIAASLKAMPTAGWEDVLKHAALLSDAVVYAADERLALLALGAKPAKDAFSLATGLQAAVTAGVLRHAYDLILVDLGAFFDATSQPVLLELVRNLGVDAVIAVTAAGGADPRDLASLSEKLAASGCELLGTVENRVAKPKAA
jgi:Mrp family chromosome partitioning ATPase